MDNDDFFYLSVFGFTKDHKRDSRHNRSTYTCYAGIITYVQSPILNLSQIGIFPIH